MSTPLPLLESEFVEKYKKALRCLKAKPKKLKEYYVLDKELDKMGKEIASMTGEHPDSEVWIRLVGNLE